MSTTGPEGAPTKTMDSQHFEDAIGRDLELKRPETLEEIEIDPAAEKKLRWKIDLYLMPAIWVLMVMSYIVSSYPQAPTTQY